MGRFNSEAVVDRSMYSLVTAKILFCGLNGDVPEKKLDLVEFATCSPAETGARPTKVMGRQFFNSGLFGAILDDVPDNPLCHAVTPDFPRTADASEKTAMRYLGGSQPKVDSGLDPFGDGDSTNMAAFSDQINNGPVVLASLELGYVERCGFSATQPTPQQNRE